MTAGDCALADEGGTSFWLPGQMGSFAALPVDTGWSLPLIYYHAQSDAGSGQSFARNGRVDSGVNARADLLIANPTYTFSSPVAGGQAAIGVGALLGRLYVTVDAELGGRFGRTLSGSRTDSAYGGGDLYPTASLKWAHGAHNFMVYTMEGVPSGAYEKTRLANLGIGHWSFDAGGGYTYLDDKGGHEFSAVLGLTDNLENHHTNYRNGIDGHLDWAASQFLNEQWHIGLVGYFYQQINGDTGSGATLGPFKSSVTAIGPEIGYLFKVGDNSRQWYANLKGYSEFDQQNRPAGWNVWFTLVIPVGSAKK